MVFRHAMLWRHSRFLNVCNVVGGMVRIRMHLEACLASRRHILLYGHVWQVGGTFSCMGHFLEASSCRHTYSIT